MKLLPKSEVILNSTQDRKLSIDEGLKLARKIDELRKTATEEEAKLSQLRDYSLKAIRLEMENLMKERATLLEDIKELVNKRDYIKSQLVTLGELLDK